MTELNTFNVTGFLIAFIPGLINLGLLIYILRALPHTKLINVFVSLTFCAALWQINDAIARLNVPADIVDLWDCLLSPTWVFTAPLCLHFTLLYTKKMTNMNAYLIYGLLYLPAFLFMGLYQSHIYEHKFIHMAFWGWVNFHDHAIADTIMIYWISALVLISTVLLFRYSYLAKTDNVVSVQALLIATGIGVPTAAGVVLQVVFPTIFNKPSVPVTSSFLTIFSLCTVVALRRYRLFTLSELIDNETLLHEVPVPILSISQTGYITFANKAVLRLLKAPDRLKYHTVDQLFKSSEIETDSTFQHVIKDGLNGKKIENVEASLKTPAETIYILLSASPIVNNGRVQGILLSIKNVTDIKRSAEQVLQSARQLELAQQISHIGSWEWDVATNKLIWSDELYRIYELEPGSVDIEFGNMSSYNHPEDTARVHEIMRHSVETLEPHDFLYRIILPGKIKTLHAKGEVLVNASNKAYKLFGTLQDVTKEVETELELQQMNNELRRSNANLEEFAYVASHDLREPLRKISVFGNMLLNAEAGSISDNSKGILNRMINASERMLKMVDDILSLSRLAQEKKIEQCDLQKIHEDVLQVFEN